MEYFLMDPPFELKPFREMSKKEANIHFDWYMSQIPYRLEQLKSYFEYSDGGDKSELDLSPESLKGLWQWFMPQVKLVPRSQQEIEEHLNQFPVWVRSEILKDDSYKYELSMETLTVAMDIAIYFAEVCVREFPGIKWALITRTKRHIDFHQPVLVGFVNNVDMNPRDILHVLCQKVAEGDYSPTKLYDTFQVWRENLPK